MPDLKQEATSDKNTVTITLIKKNEKRESTISQIMGKLRDYTYGVTNSFSLITQYDALHDPNAFHHFLDQQYNKIPQNKLNAFRLTILSPSTKPQLVQSMVAIGNPRILQKLREIPDATTMHPAKFKSDLPRIARGRAFDSVLEALGMGILSAKEDIHEDFINEMIKILTIQSIDEAKYSSDKSPFKNHFVKVVQEESQKLIKQFEEAMCSKAPFIPDFRLYALTIFLRGFYPKKAWDTVWIRELSNVIADVSDRAFKCIMNPYADLTKLRETAQQMLAPYIDEIMKEDQASYLSEEYVKRTSHEILRQIIVSLLFAGGDNIKKYLDHIFIEFGREEAKCYFQEKSKEGLPFEKILEIAIKEVGRLYTTIYAQPGEALDDFVIQYRGEEIFIKEGDFIHYTIWQAMWIRWNGGYMPLSLIPRNMRSYSIV